jgi:hypothetical protein
MTLEPNDTMHTYHHHDHLDHERDNGQQEESSGAALHHGRQSPQGPTAPN